VLNLQCQVRDAVCPVALLYLLHPHAPVALAAHQLFCVVLRHLDMVSSPALL